MLWAKAFGGLCLLFSGAFAAVLATRLSRRRLEVLDGWITLLTLIRGRIDCYLDPIHEILKDCDPALLAACGDAHAGTLAALLQGASPYLDEECRRLLTEFAREFGNGYRDEQIKQCSYYTELLRSHRERLFRELPARIKLGVTVSLSGALFVLILLW